MGKISLGVNMEFVRHDDKPFEWGVEKAAELGYEYVEPMVHWGRELLSEAGYFHSVSMLDDPYRIRRACEKAGIKLSGLSGHTPAVQAGDRRRVPEAGGPLRRRVRRAGGQHRRRAQAAWTTVEEDHVLMRYTLHEAAAVAEPRGILIGIEPHQQYSKTPAGLDRIWRPGRFARHRHQLRHGQQLPGRRGPDRLAPARPGRLVHLHAKDIPHGSPTPSAAR